jgi:hypothetical protein
MYKKHVEKYSESNETNPVVEDDLERLKKELGWGAEV